VDAIVFGVFCSELSDVKTNVLHLDIW